MKTGSRCYVAFVYTLFFVEYMFHTYAFQVNLKLQFGPVKSATIDVEPTDTVEIVKGKVQDITAVPTEQQALTFKSRNMEGSERTMSDYNVQSDSTIVVGLKLMGGGLNFIPLDPSQLSNQFGFVGSILGKLKAIEGKQGESSYRCTGSLLENGGRRYVLTAAHCVDRQWLATRKPLEKRVDGKLKYVKHEISPGTMFVFFAGKSDKNDGKNFMHAKISSKVKSATFPEGMDFDIALLELDKPVTNSIVDDRFDAFTLDTNGDESRFVKGKTPLFILGFGQYEARDARGLSAMQHAQGNEEQSHAIFESASGLPSAYVTNSHILRMGAMTFERLEGDGKKIVVSHRRRKYTPTPHDQHSGNEYGLPSERDMAASSGDSGAPALIRGDKSYPVVGVLSYGNKVKIDGHGRGAIRDDYKDVFTSVLPSSPAREWLDMMLDCYDSEKCWTARIDKDGINTKFVNKKTGEETNEMPKYVKGQLDEQSWSAYISTVSEHQGRAYFHSAKTGETTWQKPKFFVRVPALTEANEEGLRQLVYEDPRSHESIFVRDISSNERTRGHSRQKTKWALHVASGEYWKLDTDIKSVVPPTPWRVIHHEKKPFFWNLLTGERTWKKPEFYDSSVHSPKEHVYMPPPVTTDDSLGEKKEVKSANVESMSRNDIANHVLSPQDQLRIMKKMKSIQRKR